MDELGKQRRANLGAVFLSDFINEINYTYYLEMRRFRPIYGVIAALVGLISVLGIFSISFYRAYPRPHYSTVMESGLEPALVYAVIKAESGFREDARSKAGAVGLMQILPSTAEFICRKNGIDFSGLDLQEGEVNVTIGCMYLSYLLGRFPDLNTSICAYNAGEGVVSEWLLNEEYSSDGATLQIIPYPETREYLKKIIKIRKIYHKLYGE